MDIRKAGTNDVKNISRIHALSWKTAYKGIVPQEYLDHLKEDFWVSTFENWIRYDTLKVNVIYDGQKNVGCIAYGKSRDNTLPDWGEIVSIYLLPEYFGKGYGRELIQTALMELKSMGFENVYLWVLEENDQAKAFYKKQGFVETDDKCYCEIMEQQLIDLRYVYQGKKIIM